MVELHPQLVEANLAGTKAKPGIQNRFCLFIELSVDKEAAMYTLRTVDIEMFQNFIQKFRKYDTILDHGCVTSGLRNLISILLFVMKSAGRKAVRLGNLQASGFSVGAVRRNALQINSKAPSLKSVQAVKL